uniref:NGFI-A binding protein 2 n=1 Tax=Calidris pygmaea TaxID=425635 RepID=A0A8C3JLS0_9CHAR
MALPRTLGELQLYRVLQRANLLGYYETFIQQGGDDVQQLCEAGEEEFLEIMALVGMATKPLHVRRLQKALREWASNPGLFSQPVSAVPVSSIPLFKLSEAGGRKALSNGHASPGEAAGKGGSGAGTPPARSPTEPGEKLSPSAAPPWPGRSTPESEGGGDEEPGGPPFSPGGSGGEQPAGAETLEPELARTVAESVERLLQSCPRGGEAELRALMKLNKKLAKAVGHIFQLEDGDRHKEEEIRRHSAIYGRGEARRREGKQLTLHEVRSAIRARRSRGSVGSRLGPGWLRRWREFGKGSALVRRLGWGLQHGAGGCRSLLPPRVASARLKQRLRLPRVPWALPSPLTHRLCPQLIINEAAAQFCLRDNSLLLRRVELFSLSRQVARESTYLSSLKVTRAHPEETGATVAKRLKQEVGCAPGGCGGAHLRAQEGGRSVPGGAHTGWGRQRGALGWWPWGQCSRGYLGTGGSERSPPPHRRDGVRGRCPALTPALPAGGRAESPRAAAAAGGAGAPRGRVPSQPGGGHGQPLRGEPRRPLAGGGGLSPADATARRGPRRAPRPPPPRAVEPPHPAADADGRGAALGPAGLARARGAAQPLPPGEAPRAR